MKLSVFSKVINLIQSRSPMGLSRASSLDMVNTTDTISSLRRQSHGVVEQLSPPGMSDIVKSDCNACSPPNYCLY